MADQSVRGSGLVEPLAQADADVFDVSRQRYEAVDESGLSREIGKAVMVATLGT